MKITASILCYNYGRFLKQAIESCLNQDPGQYDLEVLVVDDGSTDATSSVCSEFGNRIRVSRTANMGFGKTLSRAFLEASGDYVCLLDADDWWMPQKLNVIVSNISSDTLFLRHPMVEVDERGKPLGGTGSCGNTSSLFVHRESAITLLPGTSEILCKPLFDVGRGIEIPAPLAYYRIHPKSMTDRDPKSSHTKFFANTNHVTANRLFTLAQSPPSWARNAAQLRKLGRCYRSEGFTKDFEASLEPYPQRDAFSKMLKMLWSWTYSRGLPEKRHIRLLGRYCKKMGEFLFPLNY